MCGREVEEYLRGRSGVELLRNDEPERGMSHSLALANRVVAADLMLLVLLGDKPLVSRSLIESIYIAGEDADVAYPVLDEVPGHPVALSPKARRYIDKLPPGDTVRLLRDRADLMQRATETADRGAIFDVDTASAFEGTS